MKRALLVLVAAVATSGCGISWGSAEYADEFGELSGRYPPEAHGAALGLARTVAVVMLLFVVWLAADVRLRGADRRQQGPALLTAAGFVVVLLGGWLAAAAS